MVNIKQLKLTYLELYKESLAYVSIYDYSREIKIPYHTLIRMLTLGYRLHLRAKGVKYTVINMAKRQVFTNQS